MPATVHIYTFKAGLLSRLAHDLRLRCERFEIEVDGGKLRASVDPSSLRIDGVMRKGTLDARGLSQSDYDKIEATVRDEVLVTRRHAEITFTGELTEAGHGVIVAGELGLFGGRVRLPSTGARRDGDHWRYEVEITPSRWGIVPYKALGGTLKIQDRVRIEVRLPVQEGVGATAGTATWSGPLPLT